MRYKCANSRRLDWSFYFHFSFFIFHFSFFIYLNSISTRLSKETLMSTGGQGSVLDFIEVPSRNNKNETVSQWAHKVCAVLWGKSLKTTSIDHPSALTIPRYKKKRNEFNRKQRRYSVLYTLYVVRGTLQGIFFNGPQRGIMVRRSCPL